MSDNLIRDVKGRQLARFLLSPVVFRDLLHGGLGAFIADLPADFEVVRVEWDFIMHMLWVIGESASFAAVEADEIDSRDLPEIVVTVTLTWKQAC